MALEGYTSFVIEGEKGKEVYDMIMNFKTKCNDGEDIEVAKFGKETYTLSVFTREYPVGGKEEITAFAWKKRNGGHACSYIHQITYKDDILRIETHWRHGPALLFYFEESGLEDHPGYFYLDSSEHNIGGTTNDENGKYFEVEIVDAPEEYIVPEGDTTLGDQYCYWNQVRKLHIPASVVEVAFIDSTPSLEEIVIDSQNPKYDSRNNCNAIIETATNKLVRGCGTTVIPNDIKIIDSSAFSGCQELTEITIPDSVKKIEARAFWFCENLTHINLPKNIKVIKSGTFEYCRKLTSIEIPEGVEEIKEQAFNGCESLQNISLPSSLNNISGRRVFEECKALTDIILPNGMTEIGEWLFARCTSLQSIVIPNKVTKIEPYAFLECKSLTSIVIPNAVTSIGSHAFSECTSLHSIVIPKSVKSIDSQAFAGCVGLRSIVIESKDVEIHEDAFRGCYLKKEAFVHHNSCEPAHNWGICFYDEEIDGICIKDNEIVHVRPNVSDVTIPEHITSIADHAFKNCSSITSIVIPDYVEKIDHSAFQHCDLLEKITLPQGLSAIADWTFDGCSTLCSIEIPASVQSIGEYAFSNCESLSEITIPKKMKSIGSDAFSKCSSLTSVIIPQSVESIGHSAFFCCEALVDIHYEGTIEQWQRIQMGCDCFYSVSTDVVRCSDGDVELLEE